MKRYVRFFFCLCVMLAAMVATAQTTRYQDLYTVKKKDTIYGIAKKYNITIDDLLRANPVMQKTDYMLKKGDQLIIPAPSPQKTTTTATPAPSVSQSQSVAKAQAPATHQAGGTVKVGIMLPLHNADGDGQRMLEYYRGVLMACDSLKAHGISTKIRAWDVPIDANVAQTLSDAGAKDCDIIFGPLYTKQVKQIGDFCRRNDIKLVIPFSINGNDVATNDHIFQVYQTPQQQTESAVNAFVERFRGAHAVIIDCNDTTSNKGAFTTALRKRLAAVGIDYSICLLYTSPSPRD